VRLIVSDTGVGMTDTVREHVFEPFFTTKPTGEGTGLGLAVIHGIVAAHGGRVQLTSAPGAGTTVDVEFPSADETLRDTSADNQAVVGRGAADARSGARLIVVDDEPSVARVLERSLTRAGYAVRVFSDPRSALQAIADAPDAVDLLLTDQTMPGLTGDVLTERVLAIAPTLPVLILTGFSHRLTSEKAAAVGARAVLQKPIALEELHRAVAHALMTPLPTGADIVTKAPG
nr:response regulator [Gemmatimonadaceae bacterium]